MSQPHPSQLITIDGIWVEIDSVTFRGGATNPDQTIDLEGKCTAAGAHELNSAFGRTVSIQQGGDKVGDFMLSRMNVEMSIRSGDLLSVYLTVQRTSPGSNWKPASTVSSMPRELADKKPKPKKHRAFFDEP